MTVEAFMAQVKHIVSHTKRRGLLLSLRPRELVLNLTSYTAISANVRELNGTHVAAAGQEREAYYMVFRKIRFSSTCFIP